MNVMMKQKFLEQYQQTSLETSMENATPHKLVGMLYDGVIENLVQVKGAIDRKEFELKAEKLNKAVLIIGSLRSNLDMEKGGEVSNNFDTLYSYINRKLLEASAKSDLQIIDEVVVLVKELRESWSLMPDNFKKATAAQIKSIKNFNKS
jgi:flagellar protein FliS